VSGTLRQPHEARLVQDFMHHGYGTLGPTPAESISNCGKIFHQPRESMRASLQLSINITLRLRPLMLNATTNPSRDYQFSVSRIFPTKFGQQDLGVTTLKPLTSSRYYVSDNFTIIFYTFLSF
jgi:hypothetical protein